MLVSYLSSSVHGSAGFALAASLFPPLWFGIAPEPSRETTPGLTRGSNSCNTVASPAWGDSTSRSPSADTAASAVAATTAACAREALGFEGRF